VRKPHTSTADLLTWSETPISDSPAPPSSATRSHQVILKICVFLLFFFWVCLVIEKFVIFFFWGWLVIEKNLIFFLGLVHNWKIYDFFVWGWLVIEKVMIFLFCLAVGWDQQGGVWGSGDRWRSWELKQTVRSKSLLSLLIFS
jgi:hypothetical protein